ncbi:cold shock domain-containing protein [Candidatus Woesearchaeota archaeon]|nr:cold shock domain-containing protein [Candidatus Woesearchaeota archaeon]
MEGTVKWYNMRKGYGFIQGEDGNDYFVHFSALDGAMLREGDKVSFQAADTDKGKQAQKVKLLQKGSERGRERKDSGEEQNVEINDDGDDDSGSDENGEEGSDGDFDDEENSEEESSEEE